MQWGYFVGPIVKTLVKKLFNVSASSFAKVALEPLGIFKVGIACLVFNLDFAYFQNNLGFTLQCQAPSEFLSQVPCKVTKIALTSYVDLPAMPSSCCYMSFPCSPVSVGLPH